MFVGEMQAKNRLFTIKRPAFLFSRGLAKNGGICYYIRYILMESYGNFRRRDIFARTFSKSKSNFKGAAQ
jgi:hypothetical protein